MRLLNVHTLRLLEFPNDEYPPYVTASHRWQEEEVSYREVRDGVNKDKKGYKKIEAFASYVRQNVPSVKWLWIDTCCINQNSAAEQSEAVNMMFDWYRNAKLCIAYLDDVNTPQDLNGFVQSEWFRRGWTLPELIAPPLVVFVTRRWRVIGNKGAVFFGHDGMEKGPRMEEIISAITHVPTSLLSSFAITARRPSIEVALEWMSVRQTSREEDKSYALYGILGVAAGANYGEGGSMAERRLLAALEDKHSSDPSSVSNRGAISYPKLTSEQYRAIRMSRGQPPMRLFDGALDGSTLELSSSAQQSRPPPVEPGSSKPSDKARELIVKVVLQIQVCHFFLLAAFLIVGGSLGIGLYYTFAKDRMGDGFTTAGWITAVGTMLLAAPMAKHYPHCKCWTKKSDRMLP